ncbi:MAG: hypothetical protein U0U67_03610 [Chitinophagales bacterium]
MKLILPILIILQSLVLCYSQNQNFKKYDTFIKGNIEDTFIICYDSIAIKITTFAGVYKTKDNTDLLSETNIDFGYEYVINDLYYLIYKNNIYLLFFVTENKKNWIALYKYQLDNLNHVRRLHFINYNKLKLESTFRIKDRIVLTFDKKVHKVNINYGLKKENKDPKIYK